MQELESLSDALVDGGEAVFRLFLDPSDGSLSSSMSMGDGVRSNSLVTEAVGEEGAEKASGGGLQSKISPTTSSSVGDRVAAVVSALEFSISVSFFLSCTRSTWGTRIAWRAGSRGRLAMFSLGEIPPLPPIVIRLRGITRAG